MPGEGAHLTMRSAWLHVDGKKVALSPQQTVIVQHLLDAGPSSYNELAYAIWGRYPDAGSVMTGRRICVLVSGLNEKLQPTAAWISGGLHRGYEFRTRTSQPPKVTTPCSTSFLGKRPTSSAPS